MQLCNKPAAACGGRRAVRVAPVRVGRTNRVCVVAQAVDAPVAPVAVKANGEAVHVGAAHAHRYPGESKYVEDLITKLRSRDPDQAEFHQAVDEVLGDVLPLLHAEHEFKAVLERLCEPERQIMFRVPWIDDSGRVRVNRGFRVQFNSAIGPYKGGIRFHPTVTLSVMKFLGFEQMFKNALTTLPMGGAKGGSDFDPKGKSDAEVMRFCQSFMLELSRHIGANTDVPAGDIGVGGREIGYMFGQYKRVTNEFSGVLTGKAPFWGGSYIRPEATGWGVVYFADEILRDREGLLATRGGAAGPAAGLAGKRCLVSGSGNVAQFAADKLLTLGATVLTMSDSTGYVIEPNGFTREALDQVIHIKSGRRTSLREYESSTGGKFVAGARPWHAGVAADLALPCATQNEVNSKDAAALTAAGVYLLLEGANMPTTPRALRHLETNGCIVAPGKAANAGGVAVSGLEMAQNAGFSQWSAPDVDARLQAIMKGVYASASAASRRFDVSLQAGANIAGFQKVARSMIDQGAV
ncbi:MAG: glutamate dehydrogenase [Monoraphidium minutum]|nr:MAG: glutamate dehydrogenase [Monoraphidium minutum]